MAIQVNTDIHLLNDIPPVRVMELGSAVAITIDNSATIYFRNVEQVEAFLRALYDARNALVYTVV